VDEDEAVEGNVDGVGGVRGKKGMLGWGEAEGLC
jgi:hypothetical protein